MDQEKQQKKENLTMQEMFMKYPVGSTMQGEDARVKGYRQTQNESALLLSDGSWKPI